MNATLKLTKRINEIAKAAYDARGDVNDGYDAHEIAHGAFRVVFIENGVAIKLARNTDYGYMNRREWDNYRKFSAGVKAITAKPICISACGCVMAIELVPMTLWNSRNHRIAERDCNEFNQKLKNMLKMSGVFTAREIDQLVRDNHENNIGVRENGDLIWIDYASY